MELVLGDCIDVLDSMDDDSVDLILTDPPYNIDKAYVGYDDDIAESDYWSWLTEVWDACYRVLKPKCHLTFTCAQKHIWDHKPICEDLGYVFRHQGIFHNPRRKGGSWPGMWPFAYEPVMDFTKGGFRKLNNGNCVGYMDVWIEAPPSGIDHPTPRPIDTWTELIELLSDPGDLVVDPFMGSGTTPLICERLDRECVGIDISEEYVELSERRIASDSATQ